MLLVHGWFVGNDFAILIEPVPTAAGRAFEAADVGWKWDGRLAEETLNVAVASEQRGHGCSGESQSGHAPAFRAMSLAPAPSASRGDVVLQPTYFTSSVYVKALRDDISTLILRYHEVYSQPQSLGPFALFKSIWLRMGWHWLQFKVFDHRSRQTFLDVTMRLFLGLILFSVLFESTSRAVLQREP
jgi:hypothetical protein